MNRNRSGSHSVTRLTAHLVWVTKYRYQVLKGEVQQRCRELIIQICDAEDVVILKGVVSKDHIHMHKVPCAAGIEYLASISISDLVKRLKGRTSRLLQRPKEVPVVQEFSHLAKRYWGRHFWAIGYGAWSTGSITEELVQAYLEHHRHPSNQDTDTFVMEE
ncbi:MAG: IS200/IS605 family transposase [Deinococcota bacterium]|nr:IS200/IS605 family transposase [Deinococcota bacterium]